MNRIPDEKAPFKAFISYAHRDDERGYVSKFRQHLEDAVGVLLGDDFPIFQDRPNIVWGDDWKERIRRSLVEEVVFLIPVLSPSFFKSEECREETLLFLEREKNYGRADLLLPVYFVNSDVFNDKSKPKKDELAQAISAHQFRDWRDYRTKPYTAAVLGRLDVMAAELKAALDRKVAPPAGDARRAATPYATPPKVRRIVDEIPPLVARARVARGVLPAKAVTGKKGRAPGRPVAVERARGAKAGRTKRAAFDQSVFVSTPYGDRYRPLFEAIVFTVASAGFLPRGIVVSEGSAGQTRLSRLLGVIGECRYGIFDLSRTAGRGEEAARLNLLLELGLFLGAQQYGDGRQRKRSTLLLDSGPQTYSGTVSDLAGYDIYSHGNRIPDVISHVRGWLAVTSKFRMIPGGADIHRRFLIFKEQLPDIYRAMGVRASEVSHLDFTALTFAWLRRMEDLNKR